MFAAKQGFYNKIPLGPTQSPFWIAVFDDFIPEAITVGNNAGPSNNEDFSLLAGRTTAGGNKGSLFRLDKLGNIDYQKQLTGAVSQFSGITTDGNQIAWVAGRTNESGTSRPYTARFDINGNLVWEKYFSDSTGSYNGIIKQFVDVTDYCVIPYGSSGSNSFYPALLETDGSVYNQYALSNISRIYAMAKDNGNASGDLFAVSIDTVPATDDIVLSWINNDPYTTNSKIISDSVANMQSPSIQWQSNRVMVSARYSAGTYGTNTQLLVFTASSSPSLVSQRLLTGAVTSSGLQLNKSQNNTFYGAATQTNNTIWYGYFDFDGTTIYDQNNLYFGTPGTNNTILNGISSTNGVANDAVYLIGTTDYYGGTKGFVARLPFAGGIPGTGTYGASNEIHLVTSTYMSLSTSSSLTISTSTTSATTPGFTDATSTLTDTTGTGTYTLNEAT